MILISEALKIIKRESFALPTETVELENAVGRILAEEVRADMDLPPFDRSQMDGFAVKTNDTQNVPVKLKIIGESVAGKGFDGEIKTGEAVRIMTGARVPKGADSVQKVELTNEDNGFIEILEPTKLQQNINLHASEIEKGALIFEKGEIITEQMIAATASFGYAKIQVFQKPKVAILSTGSEIVNIDETPDKDQIRNSNSIMLKAFAEKLKLDAEVLPLVHDDFETLKTTIAEAVGFESKVQSPKSKVDVPKSKIQNLKSKILILTGGVSVGDYDFTKPALRELGAKIFFEKVSLKPGKPTVFAKLNDVLIFGLPGNPVSVAVTFALFTRTAILQMQSAKTSELKKGCAVCADKLKGAKERDCYLPVSLSTDENGQLIIESLRFSGSSNFIAFSRADALVFIPQGKNLEKGGVAEILYL
ncbi:MAG: molybdopterin molybdotransferase MoeA [Pyrinomonadaceae bacterium]|nr:molybdopterin molybdotransferase MoeA [Pyrinomonadaceae bacterium]